MASTSADSTVQGADPDLCTGGLPDHLETLALSRFDELAARKVLIYQPSTAALYEEGGFKVSFLHTPHFGRKPITPANAPERRTGQGRNPFLNPDPEFVLSSVGPSHLLLLNKFCALRPSLLLITKQFVPQSDDLDRSDLSAAWTLLHRFSEPHMMIFNCGYESGSSQGHKHMQLLPYPNEHDLGFALFPSKATSTTDVTKNIPGVPHQHFVLRLSPDADESVLVQAYERLVREVRSAHDSAGGGAAYNVVLVPEWICLIPRRHSGVERGAGANSVAMLGLIWIISETEKEVWTCPSVADYYGYLGIPI